MKLVMMKGLPASGKSTYAKKLVEQGYKRVNRDDLRKMIDNSVWSKDNEKFIVEFEEAITGRFLIAGHDVVVDDCNLAPKNEEMWKACAESFNGLVKFEVKDFTDVSVEECIKRDASRADSVGIKVIRRMYDQFLKPSIKTVRYDPSLPNCYIFDIDGTLALRGDRSPYEWSKVGGDTPNLPVVMTLKNLRRAIGLGDTAGIFLFSGRDEICRGETEQWLVENGLGDNYILVMRPQDNVEKDSIVKQRMYETYIKGKWNVLGIFDDRQQVVDMWRSLGLPCYQVAEGDF